MKWTTACKDWEKRIVARQSLMPCAPLFPDQAETALRIFKEFVLADVAGSPTIGECTRDWVYEFVSAIFGAYDEEHGKRLITEFFLLISKKNTKSTIAAGIMLTALVLNWRQSAEYLIIAPTKEIADNSFMPARDMIKNDPELTELFNVSQHTRTITHLATGATLKVVAAESDTVGGKKATGILVDELWIFGKRANSENMFREAIGGLASRPDGFVIYLTTQSDEPPAGVFKNRLDYARNVRDGVIEDAQFLPLLYEFPKKMIESGEYTKPENFYITNPNLGASVDSKFLEREFKKADGDPEARTSFLAKHLNIEIGLNLRNDRWIGADYWLGAADSSLTLERIIEQSDVLTIGIDAGGTDDLFGIAVLGRSSKNGDWLGWVHAYAHEIVLQRRKQDAPRFKDFQADGDLTIFAEHGAECEAAAQIAKRLFDTGKLYKIGFDPWGAGVIADRMRSDGIPEDCITGVAQGFKLGGYILTLERMLAEGLLHHCDQPLMDWVVGNAKAVVKGNGLMISKQVSGSAKIDPLIALFNAVALMQDNPTPVGNIDDYLDNMVMA